MFRSNSASWDSSKEFVDAVLVGDAVHGFHCGEATQQEGLRLFWRGAGVDRQRDLWAGRKRPDLWGGRCRADNDAFAGPVEPDRDNPREAVVSVVGEPGQRAGEQLLGVGVAKLPSQLLGVHHARIFYPVRPT